MAAVAVFDRDKGDWYCPVDRAVAAPLPLLALPLEALEPPPPPPPLLCRSRLLTVTDLPTCAVGGGRKAAVVPERELDPDLFSARRSVSTDSVPLPSPS